MNQSGDVHPQPDPLPRPTSGVTLPPKGSSRGPRLALSPRIADLERRLAAADGTAAAEFWREVEVAGTPLVELVPGADSERIVTFVAREADPDVEVVLFANRVTEPEYYRSSVLQPVAGTEIRTLSLRVGAGWRAQYRIGRAPGTLDERGKEMVERSLAAGSPASREELELWWGALGGAVPDPYHRRRGGWAERVTDASWVELDQAPEAPLMRPLPDAGTRLRRVVLDGEGRLGGREVWVYRPPPVVTADPRRAGLLVLTDGEEWARNDVIAALLDPAIASGELPPLTVVLVASGGRHQRMADLACSPDFVDALHEEVLPRLVDGPTRVPPERTIIGGASLGGLTAAYAAMRLPHRFGLVYSQSGSLWWPSVTDPSEEPAWLTRCYACIPVRPLRFRIEVGLGEGALLVTTRQFRDVLTANGFDVSYQELDGGHDRLWWTASLPTGLAALTRDW